MISSVKWQGLTEMVMDLKRGVPMRTTRTVNEYTKDVLNMALQIYVENLSGGGPRKATSGLPVGVRSGDLLAGAKKRQINQYAGEVYNRVPYSGWIEEGTRRTPPRRPLGNAVDRVGWMLPGRMGKVMTTIVIETT